MIWRFLKYSAEFLNETIRKRALEFYKTLSGMKKYPPRWKECVTKTSDVLQLATSGLYVRKYFDQEWNRILNRILQNLKYEFSMMISSASWMDRFTQSSATEKLVQLVAILGYPYELSIDLNLIKFYEDLKINEHELFKSRLKINNFRLNRKFKKFRDLVIRDDWRSHPRVAEVNAFYERCENSISQ